MAARPPPDFDRDLAGLPPALRWREWMARVEAVLFASAEPVGRDTLARVVGAECSIDLLIEDVANALQDRPYELTRTAGGWQLRTRTRHAAAIRAARGDKGEDAPLSPAEGLVLTAIAYLQPVTRGALSRLIGREIGRDIIAQLHRAGFIARGPRSPEPGAPYTYVTTPAFLVHYGFDSLRDLPDMEALEDAGLLKRETDATLDLPIAGEAPRRDETPE